MLFIYLITAVAVSLKSSPGLLRCHKGDDVTFTWILNSKPTLISKVELEYHGVSLILKTTGATTVNSSYTGRISVTVSDKTIKFVLRNINKDDVKDGLYRLSLQVVEDSVLRDIADDKAELYLFGKYL